MGMGRPGMELPGELLINRRRRCHRLGLKSNLKKPGFSATSLFQSIMEAYVALYPSPIYFFAFRLIGLPSPDVHNHTNVCSASTNGDSYAVYIYT
jgi:hypothetical protein